MGSARGAANAREGAAVVKRWDLQTARRPVRRALGLLSTLLGLPLRALVAAYRIFVSPVLPPACRYYPSCSRYAAEALRIHGPLRGSRLALWRLLRCHPFCEGGVDLVPPPAGVPPRPLTSRS